MGWIYDIEYTENGRPITISVGIKKPKNVPGALVHWIDTRGDIHHENVAIYTRGPLKDKPKSTVHGCLDKNREPILKISKKSASKLADNYNSLLRKYKAHPEDNGFPSLEGKSDSEKKSIYEDMRKKANSYAINSVKKETPRMTDANNYVKDAEWQETLKNDLKWKKDMFKKVERKLALKARKIRREFGELAEEDKEGLDKLGDYIKEKITIDPVVDRNERIAEKAEELRNTPGVGVYWDEKTGHLRMGKVKSVLTKEAKNKKKRVGTKLRAYNFVKASPLDDRKGKTENQKYFAQLAREKKAEERAAEKAAKKTARKDASNRKRLNERIKALNSKSGKRAIERDEEYNREMDRADEEMKANIMDY